MTVIDDISAANLRDPVWRLSHLYWIVGKDGQRVLFTPNETQRELVANLGERDITLKARQIGVTTLMCLISLDEALFNPDWRCAIIAHRMDDAKAIFDSKVKFPYDNLPDVLRAKLPTVKDSADSLSFSNGSTITVTTSARSSTLQRLHISEFGKICATFPNKAREIITGSFPAAEHGAITIESTAEGQEGQFYEMTMRARERDPQTRKDWRFHFFPWWVDPGNTMDPRAVVVPVEDDRYFEVLRIDHGIDLSPGQKAWWVKTSQDLGGDMKRENPSTADEAFEQAIEGAYFAAQFLHAEKHEQIGAFPYDPKYPVNSFWDLGRNDFNVIWLHQRIGARNRFIGYYEDSGEHISHYINWLASWQREHDAQWGDHYWPNDGKREDLFLENGRLGEAEKHGLKPTIVDRARIKGEAIDAARSVFASCDFDAAACDLGLKRLRHYRKEWDDQRGVWKNRPRHDANSHGADAFMTFATGYSGDMPDTDYFKRGGRARTGGWLGA